jgi:predicted RNase H-like nuclease (RuvC/YqgF family)
VSDSERPDLVAFRELAHLIGQLGEEMAGWRRRAQTAEARVKELEAAATPTTKASRHAASLEKENAELRARLDAAKDRVKHLLDRTRFLRQQGEKGAAR